MRCHRGMILGRQGGKRGAELMWFCFHGDGWRIRLGVLLENCFSRLVRMRGASLGLRAPKRGKVRFGEREKRGCGRGKEGRETPPRHPDGQVGGGDLGCNRVPIAVMADLRQPRLHRFSPPLQEESSRNGNFFQRLAIQSKQGTRMRPPAAETQDTRHKTKRASRGSLASTLIERRYSATVPGADSCLNGRCSWVHCFVRGAVRPAALLVSSRPLSSFTISG
jgi:hypothetical protein